MPVKQVHLLTGIGLMRPWACGCAQVSVSSVFKKDSTHIRQKSKTHKKLFHGNLENGLNSYLLHWIYFLELASTFFKCFSTVFIDSQH